MKKISLIGSYFKNITYVYDCHAFFYNERRSREEKDEPRKKYIIRRYAHFAHRNNISLHFLWKFILFTKDF